MAGSCRICRGDETDGELVRPCKCSGSIQFVHDDCLSDWLGHRYGQSAKGTARACELCSHVYQFKPVYSDDFDPEGANLKVYAHCLWKTSVRSRARAALVLRGIFAVILASISVRITFIYVTKAGETWSGLLTLPFKNIINRVPLGNQFPVSRPFTSWLDFEFANPLVAATWSWFVNGLALLVITLFFGLTTWMIAVWTMQDPVLALECDEIMETGSGRFDLKRDLEYVKELIRDENVNAQARAHLLARVDNEFAVDPTWMPEAERQVLEQRHQAEVNREEAALEEDEGIWGLVDDLLGGPLLVRILGILMAVAFLNITLIGVLYGFPYALGRYLVVTTRDCLNTVTRVPQLPNSFGMHLITYWVGNYMIILALKTPYTLFYSLLKSSDRGRAAICTAKQIAAIEKVWMFVTIEAAIFPLFCGFLLHMAFLPVMSNTSITDALVDIWENPRIYILAQWVVGMSYMYTLCDFFKGCRSFLRPGVLYFVQDPSDPLNEPIRNFLSHSVFAHLRKISFSGLIYTGLILVGVGSVTSLFRLSGIVPVLIAPIDLKSAPGWSTLRYVGIALAFRPLVKQFKEARAAERARGNAVNIHSRLFKQEFERAARWLDLESFLFDRQVNGQRGTGHYVRAPSKDNVAYPKNTVLFMPCTESGQLLEKPHGNVREMSRFKVVWRPKYFWARIVALILWIWAKSVATIIAVILTPLIVGRGYEYICMVNNPTHNDLIHYVVGVFFAGLFTAVIERFCRLSVVEFTNMGPRLVLSSIFRFTAPQLGVRLFAPQFSGLVQPSEKIAVNYAIYLFLDLVLGQPQKGNLYLGWSLALLAAVLPDYLTVVVAGGYMMDQYMKQNRDSIEKWRMNAIEDYYLVREALLNYSE